MPAEIGILAVLVSFTMEAFEGRNPAQSWETIRHSPYRCGTLRAMIVSWESWYELLSGMGIELIPWLSAARQRCGRAHSGRRRARSGRRRRLLPRKRRRWLWNAIILRGKQECRMDILAARRGKMRVTTHS